MDAFRFIGVVFAILSLVLLSNQMALDSDDTDITCPLMDNPRTVNPKTVNETVGHNITRTIKCVNGRQMAGCCVSRLYCNYHTSHTDLSLYGPSGFRMSCSDVCCPQKYILPIPLPNLSNTTKDHDQDSSMDASDDIVDSDSDENE